MIKLKEILMNPVPTILYHATFNQLAMRIEQEGIIPLGRNFRNFEDIPNGVYLSNDPEFAKSMIEASENPNIPEKWFNEIVVIAIDTRNLDKFKFDRDPNIAPQEDEYDDTIPPDDMVYSYIYYGNIPPEAIIQITD